ncbi:hypothetical protein OAJ94_04975 [Deltaproteobacteria bacterium]|nr:hypothetical protein [Deltaproteobacteria bacterium]
MGSLISRQAGILVAVLIVASLILSGIPSSDLKQVDEVEETSGRQLGEVDCSNYTFEDLFAYSHASFDIIFQDDWASSITNATAWVNGSLSPAVRENIDGLFEGFPGGDNDWLSTDEREGVRSVGPKCIADMDTRLGMREGQPHRGGVDWNNLNWVEEGIALDEVSLVPEDHEEVRDCQSAFAQSGCKEVPVHVDDDLQIMLLQDDEGDNNMQFNQLPNMGTEPFTIALNVTNMSDASLNFTFPAITDLRLDAWEVQEDGVTVFGLDDPSITTLEDGRLRIVVKVDYDIADWPMGKNLFLDLTTAEYVPDNPPQWSSNAPDNGDIMAFMLGSGKTMWASHELAQSWANDESQVSFNCSASNGWSWSLESGDMYITPGQGQSELTCSLFDLKNQESEFSRTWTLEQPLFFSATSGEYMGAVPITINALNGDRSGLTVSITPFQGETTGSTVSSAGPVSSNSMEINVSEMLPGIVELNVSVTGNGMADWLFTLDLGIKKESRAPEISISKTREGDNGSWDSEGYSYHIEGTVYDLDGDDISIDIEVCGYSTKINPEGATWSNEVSVVGCNNHESYVITLTATDSWDKSTSIEVSVMPLNEDTTTDKPSESPATADEGGLPAPGVIATIAMLGLAGLLRRRIDSQQ